MPAAAPASASFVDTAMSTGRPFRLWLLTASVGAVSYMPQASLPRVLPVQGAMTSTSRSFLGPMGSASSMVWMMGRPQSASSRARKSAAAPKRVSVE